MNDFCSNFYHRVRIYRLLVLESALVLFDAHVVHLYPFIIPRDAPDTNIPPPAFDIGLERDWSLKLPCPLKSFVLRSVV